jgi:hypothetical protein
MLHILWNRYRLRALIPIVCIAAIRYPRARYFNSKLSRFRWRRTITRTMPRNLTRHHAAKRLSFGFAMPVVRLQPLPSTRIEACNWFPESQTRAANATHSLSPRGTSLEPRDKRVAGATGALARQTTVLAAHGGSPKLNEVHLPSSYCDRRRATGKLLSTEETGSERALLCTETRSPV